MITETILEKMSEVLKGVIPEFEIEYKAKIAEEILKLKEERNAVILGHNYMEPALYHSIPDFVGDSLDLSRKAAQTDKQVIVFCGVRFMAETAKILNPAKTVLLPSLKAGCSLAASITAEDVKKMRGQYPGVPVVTYVNTYADVKAESDICCTSSNAKAVVESLGSKDVIFLPDEYLAKNVARDLHKQLVAINGSDELGMAGYSGKLYYWNGRCEVHEQFTTDDIKMIRAQFPDVKVLSHPECSPQVVEASDFSGSTNAMISYAKRIRSRILLLTECSMGDNIIASNPEANILRLCSVRCPHMNQITLEDTLDSLKNMRYQIEVPEDIRARAARAVERMIKVS